MELSELLQGANLDGGTYEVCLCAARGTGHYVLELLDFLDLGLLDLGFSDYLDSDSLDFRKASGLAR